MTGDLVLTGANTYKGGTTVAARAPIQRPDTAVPGTGTITINSGGALALDSAGNYSTVTGWLDSGLIAPSSAGALAVANDSETINIGGYAGLSLGTIGSVTFSGALVPGGTPITWVAAVERSPSPLQWRTARAAPWASMSAGRGPWSSRGQQHL